MDSTLTAPETKSPTRPLPSLDRDWAFWGMTATQFLGAFNDNVFKQLVLLICVDYTRATGATGDPFQPIAQFLFTIPFILFSGFAGYLSDRFSKRHVVVLAKVAEIGIMAAGALSFALFAPGTWGLMIGLMAVLFLMGSQSAFFGPSKYGILPELFREEDLPRANGLIQMTTFLAIILGIALAGGLKHYFQDHLWVVSLFCILIAVAGTQTSLLVRRTAVARPDLPFHWSCLLIEKTTFRSIGANPGLFWVLLVYAVFWFAGGVVLPAVNDVSKNQLGLNDLETGLLAACLAVGIAAGCMWAGLLARGQERLDFVPRAALAMVLFLAGATWVAVMPFPQVVRGIGVGCFFVAAGLSAGFMAVPLQVYLQAHAPRDQKGRVIGAMNLITWLGIIASIPYYYAASVVSEQWGWPPCIIFVAVAPVLIVVAILFRPYAKRAEQTMRSGSTGQT
jgi:acyl-[acyl-carrier-protein]-phospholipid O-acyltransferase/long-chain-fatty-acid--[acyl-carrier-protein] ligase